MCLVFLQKNSLCKALLNLTDSRPSWSVWSVFLQKNPLCKALSNLTESRPRWFAWSVFLQKNSLCKALLNLTESRPRWSAWSVFLQKNSLCKALLNLTESRPSWSACRDLQPKPVLLSRWHFVLWHATYAVLNTVQVSGVVMVTGRYVSSSHHVFHKPIIELCCCTLICIQDALRSTRLNCLYTSL